MKYMPPLSLRMFKVPPENYYGTARRLSTTELWMSERPVEVILFSEYGLFTKK